MQWWLFAPKKLNQTGTKTSFDLLLGWAFWNCSLTLNDRQPGPIKTKLNHGLTKTWMSNVDCIEPRPQPWTLQIYPWIYSPPKKERERDSVIYQYQWMAPTSASAADSPTQSAPDTIENNLQVHSLNLWSQYIQRFWRSILQRIKLNESDSIRFTFKLIYDFFSRIF